MSGPNVILASEANINLFAMSAITEKNGKKNAYITYDGNQFSLRIGPLNAPFGGPSKFNETSGYSLSLTFSGKDKHADAIARTELLLHQLDEFIVDFCFDNTLKVFGRKHKSRETVDALHNKMVKLSVDKVSKEPDGLYPARISIKMMNDHEDPTKPIGNFFSGKQEMKFNTFEEMLERVYIPTRSLVTSVMKPSFYIINGKVGLSWKSQVLKVSPSNNAIPKGYSFVQDSDDEEDKEEEEEEEKEPDESTIETPNESTIETPGDENVSDSGSGSDEDGSDDEE